MFLQSISKENSNFIHGVEYYGCYLGIKNNFTINVEDDIQILSESEYFHDNNEKLFSLNYVVPSVDESINESSKNRSKLHIEDNIENDLIVLDNIETLPYINLSSSQSSMISENQNIYRMNTPQLLNTEQQLSDDINKNIIECLENTISNREELSDENSDIILAGDDENDTSSIVTDISESESDDKDNDNSDNDDNDNSDYETIDDSICSDNTLSDTSSSCEIEATIHSFPVALILLERCEQTLEHYVNMRRNDYYEQFESESECESECESEPENETQPHSKEEESNNDNSINNKTNTKIVDITRMEWQSILFQILMILVYYQKHYNFTHNDLHSCNIMYQTTNVEYLYYKYESQYFKVPTYGKIYKIIDFGRSIFNYNDITFCSDSFGPGEDLHIHNTIASHSSMKVNQD